MKASDLSVYERTPTTIIAEIGVNHNGDMKIAKKLIDVAKECGAAFVKFQTFVPELVASPLAAKAQYQKENTGDSKGQLDMIRNLALSAAQFRELKDYCDNVAIEFMSTPFDIESVRLLNELQVSVLKSPSGEITNPLLLLEMAKTKLPIILSTGMATLGEIETALGVLAFGYLTPAMQPSKLACEEFQAAYVSPEGQAELRSKVTILHCTSEYPAAFEDVNLRAMQSLGVSFGLAIGYSDHSLGSEVAIGAVALGATVIEKHITLDKRLPGPDHAASLEPSEFRNFVISIRNIERALGGSTKMPTKGELLNRMVARRSLVALREIKAGDWFSEENLGTRRPGTGVSPFEFWQYIGTKSQRNYSTGDLVQTM